MYEHWVVPVFITIVAGTAFPAPFTLLNKLLPETYPVIISAIIQIAL